MMRISVIVPTLNESDSIVATLDRLKPFRMDGHEVIIVDGGSKDETVKLATSRADKIIKSAPGRAQQMNIGANQAIGDVLWFLHADTLVPDNATQLILRVCENQENQWGRFNIRLSGKHPLLRMVERLMNLRSRITGIATGDQGIFVRREAFESVGGYMPIPLMEDLDISKRLKKLSRPCCLDAKLITSSRRWEENGVLRTILFMWRLRLAYTLGVSPEKLAHDYKFSD
jgi:rSAM/selenodomain-associated transferase 2